MGNINFEGKKILVTGGNGYLGKNLIIKLLELNASVYSIDLTNKFENKSINNYIVDLNDEVLLSNIVNEIQPKIIFHLAASLNRTRDFLQANSLLKTNLIGTVNLLNALKNVEYDNLIFTSTSEVYGGCSIKPPFKEDDSFIPASPYSLSKYCAEATLKTYSQIYSKHYTILRLFNFFGNEMPPTFFIPQLLEKLKKDEDFNMTKGEQNRDFLYIEDVINAMVLSTKTSAYNQIFNICSGKEKSIKELALEIKKYLNSESKINFGAIPYQTNEVWSMVGDNNKIKNILGWEPKFTVLEGIQQYNQK